MKLPVKLALGGVATLLLMQVVRFEHTNPPVDGEVDAPPEVKLLLKRACYDCHSHETAWPWYTSVAPVSWLVHRDVTDGRRHLNFSSWATVAPERKAKKLKELVEEVQGGDMPPWFYLPMHPAAKLTPAEQQVLVGWANGAH